MSAPRDEPVLDVAHLAHVEILTPTLAETVECLTTIFGLQKTHQSASAVYLRAWGDYYHHTLKVTQAPQPGLGHVGWRAMSPGALDRRVTVLTDGGWGRGWTTDEVGHGPAFRFVDPAGHPMELFYEVDWYEAAPRGRTRLKNQPQKRPLSGIGTRRIDHVNLMARDVTANQQFLQDTLGFKLREHIVHNGVEIGAWLSVTALVHDIAYMRDPAPIDGRFHHVAFWLDDASELIRAAELLREAGVRIEAGPAKHAITNAMFIYCYEPGGNRLELFTGGYLIFPPDWRPVTWTEAERDLRVWWGGELPDSFFSYATPVVEKTKANVSS